MRIIAYIIVLGSLHNYSTGMYGVPQTDLHMMLVTIWASAATSNPVGLALIHEAETCYLWSASEEDSAEFAFDALSPEILDSNWWLQDMHTLIHTEG